MRGASCHVVVVVVVVVVLVACFADNVASDYLSAIGSAIVLKDAKMKKRDFVFGGRQIGCVP